MAHIFQNKMHKWLADFSWDDPDELHKNNLWKEANENGVQSFIEHIIDDNFIMITQDKKTGKINVDGHIGPLTFRAKWSEMETDKDWTDKQTMRYGKLKIGFDGS